MRVNGQTSSNFTLTNTTRAEFDSGSEFKEQRAEITDRACLVVFCAGESSLKIPYSTIAVNRQTHEIFHISQVFLFIFKYYEVHTAKIYRLKFISVNYSVQLVMNFSSFFAKYHENENIHESQCELHLCMHNHRVLLFLFFIKFLINLDYFDSIREVKIRQRFQTGFSKNSKFALLMQKVCHCPKR